MTCIFCHRTRWGNLPSRAAKPFPCLQLTGHVYKVSSKASEQTRVILLLFYLASCCPFCSWRNANAPRLEFLELTLYRGEALILTLH